MKVAIAICTYRRPASLARLLRALATLDPVASADHEDVKVDVVVIDNDDANEGRSMAEQLAPELPFSLTAGHASTPGLSAARNRAVELALSLRPDLIAFLDDDEWPEPCWLAELVRVQRAHEADVVGGPTRSVFPDHARPEQIANAYYGADLAIADGERCRLEAGGNFLLRTEVLAGLGDLPFDPEFARSGGEDLAVFTALARLGARMHWAAGAIVHESVPDDRLADGWMRQRVINIANSRVRVMQRFEPGAIASLVRVCKTLALGTVAALMTIGGFARPALANRAALLRWKFLGKLRAHLGQVTERQESYG